MPYPYQRPRRLRQSAAIRAMVREHGLAPSDLIAPLFIIEGDNHAEEISAMPGYYRQTLDRTVEEARGLYQLGIRSVLLFVKVAQDQKDNTGSAAVDPDGLMPRAVKALKRALPELCVMTDVALDPYSSYGHDGIVKDEQILNDESVDILAEMALMHIQAGADIVAPSDMMDGRIFAMREVLERAGHPHAGIMSYTAKYASGFYGPFRTALDSAPGFGDKATYQMDPSNAREALREAELDIEEGADILMVKPGMPYLDIVKLYADTYDLPIAVYQVSGEYAMIKAASAAGYLDERTAMLESLLAFKRAGAKLIATYFAKDAALAMMGR
ncbi:MAG: porphobilinogen synthase [Bacteroidota bacterium]